MNKRRALDNLLPTVFEMKKALSGISVIAKLRGIDSWRKSKRARTCSLDSEREWASEASATPEQKVMQEELTEAFRNTLTALPVECAALLLAKYEDHRSLQRACLP